MSCTTEKSCADTLFLASIISSLNISIMALRNSPYLPLYVQDFLTDEKLVDCSASANGVYIRLMCILHKSEPYGKILLKQKYKQSESMCLNFASMLLRQMPYSMSEIHDGLEELLDNKIIEIEGDYLLQKRMVKDGELSEKRAVAGQKGGKKSLGICLSKMSSKSKSKNISKSEANSENENDIDIENENNIKKFSFLSLLTLNKTNKPIPDPVNKPPINIPVVITLLRYNSVKIILAEQFGIKPTRLAKKGPKKLFLSKILLIVSSPK